MTIHEQIKYCLDNLREVPDEFKESTELLKKWLLRPDSEGIMPEIYITMSNRTGGKTYFIAYLLFDLWRRFGTKFALETRTGSELGNVVGGIFSAVMEEFPGFTIEERIAVPNVYSEIVCKYDCEEEDDKEDGESMKTVKKSEVIGYVLVLNASDKIKKFSSEFYDVDIMFLDEFQADRYLAGEVDKWVNIHMSVARGHGKASRCVPIIMASNSLTIINPYFAMWKLESKIQANTKFYRAPGLSVLRFVNDAVAKQQSESRFNIACSGNKQLESNITNSWLNDNRACVCKPDETWGNNVYVCTFVKGDEKFALRFYDNGIVYVNRSIDLTCKDVYALSVDGVENIECAKRSTPLAILNREFLRGNARFSDLSCKYTILDWI